jgi:hypothetical protein
MLAWDAFVAVLGSFPATHGHQQSMEREVAVVNDHAGIRASSRWGIQCSRASVRGGWLAISAEHQLERPSG